MSAHADSGSTWTDITGANTASYVRRRTIAGVYQYRLAVAEGNSITSPACRVTSNVITINVLAKPTANAGPDKSVFEGTSVILNGVATGTNLSYKWAPNFHLNDPSLLQPEASPPVDTTYTLQVVSNDGCGSSTDMMTIHVFKNLKVPMVITVMWQALH